MAISERFIQELQERVDIEEVISSHITLRRRGKTLVGLCPFHNEKTPSFTVYPDTNSFYCFGCGAGGDVISFIRRIDNLDYVEAVKTVAQMAGMSMPEDGYDDTLAKRRMRLLAANREAARFFNACLMDEKNRPALDYFLRRALTTATIRHFGLGYAPDSWHALTEHLRSKGFTYEEMVLANLVRRSDKNGKANYYDNFRNRVMFPIIDLRGNVIAFGGRVMDDSKPKYINTSDTPVYKKSNGVFALNFAKNANENKLLLVEGYMDVIALHQAGFTNAIACLGTAFTSEQANLLSRYAEEIIICYDNDGAGREATQRALNVLGKTGLKLRVVTMSGGKDADEIIRTHGKERFAELLGMAANKTEYRLLQERNKYNLNTDDGKLRFLTAAAQILAECSAIECDIYATRLSNELGVSAESINAQIRSVKTRQRRSDESKRLKESEALIERSFADKNNPQRAANIRAAKAEETLIASLMRNPDFYPKLKDKFSADDFVTDFNKRIMRCLADKLDKGFIPELSLFAREFTPEEMGSVTRIYMSSAELNNTLRECEDCISVLQNAAESKPTDVSSLSAEEYLKLFNKK
ncbi:MAG: DNA primase [Clostridium sp.]|jgi:DNA primase|nr:DNA primase [Clostridium sp.]MDY5896254.1 DNA primase [Oscillospiraceae bacterium]